MGCIQPQEWRSSLANVVVTVGTRTVRVAAEDDVVAISEAVRSLGGVVTFHPDAHFERRYGTLKGDIGHTHAVLYDTEIIAVAVTPSTSEALPLLESAFVGPGRPSGIVGAERVGDTIIIEWEPQRTTADVVFALIDIELGRFRASRRTCVLTPLSVELVAKIAGEALRAPGISATHVLEARMHECGIDV